MIIALLNCEHLEAETLSNVSVKYYVQLYCSEQKQILTSLYSTFHFQAPRRRQPPLGQVNSCPVTHNSSTQQFKTKLKTFSYPWGETRTKMLLPVVSTASWEGLCVRGRYGEKIKGNKTVASRRAAHLWHQAGRYSDWRWNRGSHWVLSIETLFRCFNMDTRA